MNRMNDYDYNKMLEELELMDAKDKSKKQKVKFSFNLIEQNY